MKQISLSKSVEEKIKSGLFSPEECERIQGILIEYKKMIREVLSKAIDLLHFFTEYENALVEAEGCDELAYRLQEILEKMEEKDVGL